MIAALTGRLAYKTPSCITLDIQGVGYEVFIPLSTYYALPDLNESVTLSVHTHIREDAIQLFGFLTSSEKEVFVLLIGISGIGPRLALSMLSTMSVSDIISAIQAGDVEKLATVPGIGKKSAGRISLELKDKIEKLRLIPTKLPDSSLSSSSRLQDDALSALVNLGYRAAEAKEVLKRIVHSRPDLASLKDLIREALKDLAKG